MNFNDIQKTLNIVISKLNKTNSGIKYLNQYSETLEDAIAILEDLVSQIEEIRHDPND